MKTKRQTILFFANKSSFVCVANSYYPPHDIDALKGLYIEICKANTDNVKKASFVYYLLKDWSKKEAELFSAKSMIPQTFTSLIDAFYALDNLKVVVSQSC